MGTYLTWGTHCGLIASASQPVADPTGEDSGSIDYRAIAYQFKTPVGGCTITEIGFWLAASNNGATNWEACVYHDVSGDAATKAEGTGYGPTALAVNTASGWIRGTVDYELESNTDYWFAIEIDTATPDVATDYDSTDTTHNGSQLDETTTLPSTWNGSAPSGMLLRAMYALYEEAGEAAPSISVSETLILTEALD